MEALAGGGGGGANFINFLYKVLGRRSFQLEPFYKTPFKTTPLPLESILSMPLSFIQQGP